MLSQFLNPKAQQDFVQMTLRRHVLTGDLYKPTKNGPIQNMKLLRCCQGSLLLWRRVSVWNCNSLFKSTHRDTHRARARNQGKKVIVHLLFQVITDVSHWSVCISWDIWQRHALNFLGENFHRHLVDWNKVIILGFIKSRNSSSNNNNNNTSKHWSWTSKRFVISWTVAIFNYESLYSVVVCTAKRSVSFRVSCKVPEVFSAA